MPGHVKKTTGPDEDPCPYLVVTLEMKREHAMKVYDSKKSYWCPDNKGNFIECLLESNDGTKAVVMCGHEVNIQRTSKFHNYLIGGEGIAEFLEGEYLFEQNVHFLNWKWKSYFVK